MGFVYCFLILIVATFVNFAMLHNSNAVITKCNLIIFNENQRVFATSFISPKLTGVSGGYLERFWFAKQSKLVVLASSKFSCTANQIKMAPPLGPLLAQFLSGLAAEFISFLNDTISLFQKNLISSQEVGFDVFSVKLLKFNTEELKMNLSFNMNQNLFSSEVLQGVAAAWKNSFSLVDTSFVEVESGLGLEQTRLILKNSLKLELQGFLLLNLYLLFCSWVSDEFLIKNEKAREFLIFNKKSTGFILPLFTPYTILDLSATTSGLGYGLFLHLFQSIAVIYRGLSICFNKRGGRGLVARKRL